jgi:hypothetical protein
MNLEEMIIVQVTVPNPYSDTTGNSRSSDVGSNIYLDSDDGLRGGGNFICTADNIQFDYIELYYKIPVNNQNNRRLLLGENDDKSDSFEVIARQAAINGEVRVGFHFYMKIAGVNKMKWYGYDPDYDLIQDSSDSLESLNC